tara:strand:- start:1168 stop:1350 length:183 start_codon:yes stop_codon:yes gene_type:complete
MSDEDKIEYGSIEWMENEEEKARQLFIKQNGREPTYYELHGHPNWKEQLKKHLERINHER